MTGGFIHQLFEDQVRQAPDQAAVIAESARLSYRELDGSANRLAAYLVARGGAPGAGSTVAICTEQPLDALVAMVAALKAGYAYTVVAPGTPREEMRRLLGLTRAEVVITRRRLLARIDDGRRRTEICLDGDEEAIAAQSDAAPQGGGAGNGRATLLFTAGTTGERRPVVSGHGRWLAAYTAWAEVYALTARDGLLVTAGPETTEFTGGWIRALCSGGTLVLSERAAGPEDITVAEVDPATAARLAEREPPALRLLAVGGGPLRLDEQLRLAGLLPAPGARVLSVYGPAEVVGCGTWFEAEQLPGPVEHPERAAYLGRPFPGCAAELRKGGLWLTPPDGGDAVPTGDMGRRHGEGPLEFRGRTADRVEIGGRTVDTYRVESALTGHPDIREVVVTGDRGRTGGALIAYVVAGPGGAAPDASSLRARLTGLVPAADIPRTVVPIASLPRNTAGRVDRAALPLPPVPEAVRHTGKGGFTAEGRSAAVGGCAVPFAAGVLAASLTGTLWPGSTDLTGVPSPWSGLFGLLYVVEVLAFAAGAGFLVAGRKPMLRRGGRRGLTTAAHLAIVWLLVAWWPQDNLYRLAAKQDWPRQAALVYTFNVPLMIAAGIVVAWAVTGPPPARRGD
ncbi:AMP-binding protein [Streptomyces lushanensis]|uniref:AMP-binding protein n=1 Tax=Streptomyces lushanensis TaxID=1434255 RepID=UPI00082D2ECE|nr:AMP-binding protein [Streptomyces lushanensis]